MGFSKLFFFEIKLSKVFFQSFSVKFSACFFKVFYKVFLRFSKVFSMGLS